MKNYVLKNDSFLPTPRTISLINLDGDSGSFISHIVFQAHEYRDNKEVALGSGESKLLSIDVYFKPGKETPAMKKRFESIPLVWWRSSFDCESLINQKNTEYIVRFIEEIKKIEPIPLSALREIQAKNKMDLSFCIAYGEISELMEQDKFQDALKQVLEMHHQGDEEAFKFLANFYEEKYKNARQKFKESLGKKERTKIALAQFNEGVYEEANQDQLSKFKATREALDNYINVIVNIPDTHHACTKLHAVAHEWLLPFTGTKNEFELKKVLEQLFVTAVKAKLPQAAHFYNQLSGYSGVYPTIRNMECNPSTLIKIAHEDEALVNIINKRKEEISQSARELKEMQTIFENKSHKVNSNNACREMLTTKFKALNNTLGRFFKDNQKPFMEPQKKKNAHCYIY